MERVRLSAVAAMLFFAPPPLFSPPPMLPGVAVSQFEFLAALSQQPLHLFILEACGGGRLHNPPTAMLPLPHALPTLEHCRKAALQQTVRVTPALPPSRESPIEPPNFGLRPLRGIEKGSPK